MKYPVYIKIVKTGQVLKAIDYLGISDCYDCRYKGKRELVDVQEPVLFSRDKKEWLTLDEQMEKDNPKEVYPKGSLMYLIDKHIGDAFDHCFMQASKEQFKK